MKSHTATLATALLLLAVPPARAQRKKPLSWAHDGQHIVDGKIWREPLTWKEVAPTPRPAKKPDDTRKRFEQALAAARGGKKVSNRVLSGERSRSTLPRQPIRRPGTRTSADGKVYAAVIDGELWTWSGAAKARKVAEGLAGIRRYEMAPDGSAISYIKSNDLYITRLKDGATRRLSRDGGENLFYGELDWVYQEEVYGRGNFKGTWWAPDGRHLAFLRIDEEGVDTFTVVDHIPDQLELEYIKYPKAGRTNPRATLHVARADSGAKVAIDLSGYKPEDEILIVHVGWTPQADRVVLVVQNREQTWLDLDFADPRTGKLKTIIHESCSDGWVNRLALPRWLRDGTFLWESERTGFKHLYRYRRDGKLVATISHGAWEMRSSIRLDEERGWIVFTGTVPGYAVGQNAWRATLDGKSLVRLTRGRGSHRISLNGDGTLLLDRFSNMENPGEQWLRKADGSDVRKIYAGTPPAGAVLPQWKQIKARDGEILDIAFTLPANFDPAKKYPVWIDTYSGPDAPSVRDTWRGPGRRQWYARLQVNVRSASGRGMKYTKACYRQFGVQELADIEDAIDWLCANHPWADAKRVGISGWSYGGFMTAFALTHSDKFKCGIAGGGVYSWKLYDTIYTERYMATPQHNPAGYARTSVVKAAKNLKGELLILHGTMDDNVHMQNTMQFLYALQRANKQNFALMVYPRSRHGVGGAHIRELRRRFMREHL